ncbi:hypothetical protein D6833_01850, partial [Candidatus Parcubacteria bacterium]
ELRGTPDNPQFFEVSGQRFTPTFKRSAALTDAEKAILRREFGIGSATENIPPGAQRFSRIPDVSQRLTPFPQQPDQQKIFEQEQERTQKMIDAIRASFANQIAQEQQLGKANEARVRAMNVAAGLTGSDFASAAAQKAQEATAKRVGLVQKERDAKIAELLAGVDARAQERIRAEKEQFLKQNELALQERQALIDRMKKEAQQSVAALAQSGVSLNKFKELEPQRYEELKRQLGVGDTELGALWTSSVPQDQIVARFQAGNKYVVLTRGADGGIQKQEFDIPEQVQKLTSRGFQFEVVDGVPIVFNRDTGEARVVKDIQQQLGTAEKSKQFLTKDFLRNTLSEAELEKAAKDAGFVKKEGGFFGFGQQERGDIEAYLNHIEQVIQQWRDAGFTDEEILKKL